MPFASSLLRLAIRPSWAVALLAVFSAVLMTWPLAVNTRDHVLGAMYGWDAYTNAMILGSRVDAVFGSGALGFYDNYFFAPLPDSIVFNENHFGLSLLFAPTYLATADPILAYNLTLLLSLALSVFFTHLLVRHLTGSRLAGAICGVAFAYCPYVMFELGRIQLIATQWIPASLLLLHRSLERPTVGRSLLDRRRCWDLVAFWTCVLLQVGTCLYYAMFLVPVLGLVGARLLFRERPSKPLLGAFIAGGGLAGALALALVHPYFSARKGFALERSLSFAAGYDGKLSFLGNVHPTNQTLTWLHHLGRFRGAHEEVAFPGFVLLALCALACLVPLTAWARRGGAKNVLSTGLAGLAILGIGLLLSIMGGSLLWGMLVLAVGLWWGRRLPGLNCFFCGNHGLYLALLLLVLVMYLGLYPLQWSGQPVKGLYYYFHTYFPGFNGIRKVSRQAVMTSLGFCLLAGFGAAWLLGRIRHLRGRLLLTTALLVLVVLELRCFPHPIEPLWAASTVPEAYRFLRSRPPQDLVAVTPQSGGLRRFRGDAGMAYHNYLALFHKHRFVNGQSSWTLPVTELARRALAALPADGAVRALQSLGVRHVLVHAADLPPSRRQALERFDEHPALRQAFQHGTDHVFTLSRPMDASLDLRKIPPLPSHAQRIPNERLQARASLHPRAARKALDEDLTTYWSGGRVQARGQSFELELDTAERLIALELRSPTRVMDVPMSFTVSVGGTDGDWIPVLTEPRLQLTRQQIFSPKTHVFRVVLPRPMRTRRIRVTIAQPVPGHYFSVHEARLYGLNR